MHKIVKMLQIHNGNISRMTLKVENVRFLTNTLYAKLVTISIHTRQIVCYDRPLESLVNDRI